MTKELSPPNTEISTVDTALEEQKYPELSAVPADKTPLIAAGVILGIIALVTIGFTSYAIFTKSEYIAEMLRDIATLRDLSIILVAGLLVVIAIILVVLIVVLTYIGLKLNDLLNLLNRQLQPLLDKANQTATSANQTVKTVQNRVSLVSDEAVKPVINALSYVSAVKAIAKTLFQR